MRRAIRIATEVAGALLVACLVGFGVAYAAEPRLGAIEARSSVGEPVAARIPVYAVDPDDLERFEVALAPSEVFARAGVERSRALDELGFEWVSEGEGAPYIRVQSETPIDEPLLDFLIRVSWPAGELTREYTLLLDEPTTLDAPPAAGEPRRPAAERPPLDPATADGQEEEIARAGAREAPRDFWPVMRGDTLWQIAAEHRPDDSVTMAQTMLAIKRLNPHAFASDNVNDLLAGWWLQLPDKAEIEALSAREAQTIYASHLEAWVPPAERAALVSEVDTQPDPEHEARRPEGDERPARDAHLRIVALGDEPGEDVLALLDADLEATEANLRRLQGAVAALREERASLRSERDNLQARVQDLSERVEALERLLDLRMERVLPPPPTAFEFGVPDEPIPEPTPEPTPEPVPEPAPTPTEEVAEEEPAVAPWWANLLGVDLNELEVAPSELTTAHLWEEETLRQRLLLILGVLLVTLSVLIGLISYLRRQRLQRQRQTRQRFDPADLGFDVEQEQEQYRSRRDPLEVAEDYIAEDQLTEAREVLERGSYREPQRADLRLKLLDVLARLDERDAFLNEAQELYDRTRSDSDPVWQTALAIGRRFAPDAPLFGGLAAGVAGMAAAATLADDDGMGSPAMGEEEAIAEDDGDDDLDAKPDLEALDLGFDEDDEEDSSVDSPAESALEESSEAGTEEETEESLDQQFDELFGPEEEAESSEPEPALQQSVDESAAAQDAADELFGNDDPAESQEDETDEAAAGDELEEMDLDALLSEEETETPTAEPSSESEPEPESEPSPAAAAEPEPAEPVQEPAEEVPEETEEADDDADDDEEWALGPGEGDQADTMLDLARAYIDLGDEGSAREMLEEVIETGTESQRESARRILADLD
ncbi:hypothetical protein CKO15_03150 [Halorhodospira abdelmalekii]|uniref:FimV/HubP family polar landmark protein n=1 Tax=Halorhodospira abdelmalekii TaxID=421629 RepID=UPI001907237F|nr:hypothetical protein [Halorhodospira abdelmalekii]